MQTGDELKKMLFPVFVVALAILLAACAPQAGRVAASAGQPIDSAPTQTAESVLPAENPDSLTKVDEQGAVAVEITPLNLENPGETLDFDVAMNTHSVDLGMNLVKLATLVTDTGREVTASAWDAPAGGHHVRGKLSFSSSYDGKPLLEGATRVTLYLKNVDASLRLFTWQLP